MSPYVCSIEDLVISHHNNDRKAYKRGILLSLPDNPENCFECVKES